MEIILKNFLKKFKKNQVGPISLKIYEKKITAILGSSGSGKSVLINSIIGATRNFKGDIFVKNTSRKKLDNYKVNKFIGFYTQIDFSLYKINVVLFLKTICLVYGIEKKEINKKIEYWLNYFDLWVAKDKNVNEFSWGMKNRLNLILCFIKDAEIIIMDEPGANLDSYWRNRVKNLLVEYKNRGKTIIITVHNIDEISDIIDEYVILENGKKVFEGSREELNVFSKYKIYIKDKFDLDQFRNFLNNKNIKSFKFDEQENSLVISIDEYKQINYLFLYLIKNNLPLVNLMKLPINMESIHNALGIKVEIKSNEED
ncbi:ATP-binding cassette domain-containing protein [Spiroplasma diminutum]|uniref:ABC transporter ATP-binding protein n=1 Tax=Spiroplasma diminutum CUAS-1 TaxID=1276221 RepID=S5M017_9MOLU|nr:ABC transporter ATP-binding protein [Spiroplasma diminutum]AGR42176.1 ABC transporter ATP-binding protein [Spiroplasma diminutum CUAS-1]